MYVMNVCYDMPGINFGFEDFYSSVLSSLASFLCAAQMSPQRMKPYCPQTECVHAICTHKKSIRCLCNKTYSYISCCPQAR